MSLLLAAALVIQASVEDGKTLRVHVEGACLAHGSVVTLRLTREIATRPDLPWVRWLGVATPGTTEATYPIPFTPGRYRVEVSLEPDRQPTEEVPPGGFPKPAEAVVEIGMEGKAYLQALLKAEDSLFRFSGELDGVVQRMDALGAMEDQPTAVSEWLLWRMGAMDRSREIGRYAREAAQAFFPVGASALAGLGGREMVKAEAERFHALKQGGKALPKKPEPPRTLLEESYRYRMSVLKDQVKTLQDELKRPPDRARWDLRIGRVREVLALWGEGLPEAAALEQAFLDAAAKEGKPVPEYLPARPPLHPKGLLGLHQAMLAWIAAEEARLFDAEKHPEAAGQAEALKKDLGRRFDALSALAPVAEGDAGKAILHFFEYYGR